MEGLMNLVDTPLLPPGFKVPASRNEDPSQSLRRLLASRPYVFGPGVYDPMGAELVMYHGFDAVYFSGYSFAVGHLGTTDMDLYSSVEIADGARRTVSALRKFQLTMAMGDPEKGAPPIHLEIPPVVVDMDAGYGNLFNVQRTTDLYVRAGVAAAHLEDQVMPKRCGHIAGKALISADEFVGKLKMMRCPISCGVSFRPPSAARSRNSAPRSTNVFPRRGSRSTTRPRSSGSTRRTP